MRRTLAIALAAGLLLLGGCGRARAHEPATPAAPPATTAPAATAATPTKATTGTKTGQDVDNLLDQAGQQLSDDAKAPEDED